MSDPQAVLEKLRDRYPHEEEHLQAVSETFKDIAEAYRNEPSFHAMNILERLVEPDRIISFRVDWQNDKGEIETNRAWRVQFNNAIGTYKGGIRFNAGVTPSVLKFLGYEQTYKNALTGLPMGGGKGGADFNPRGRSDVEIMRFCNAFMTELTRHIGPDIDIPAGDIGVGAREIGYLFGAYKRRSGAVNAALTGKPLPIGGSALRVEATGYGLLFFVDCMLKEMDESIDGKKIIISGAGNVARHAAEKAVKMGASVIAMSDSQGVLSKNDGFTADDIETINAAKTDHGGSLDDARGAGIDGADWSTDCPIWSIACDIALPCATQNDIGKDDAQSLINNGCILLAEGANMPCTSDAATALRQSSVAYAPGKAANAGGVSVSGFEISQNRTRMPKSTETIHADLRDVMADIHNTCRENADTHGDSPIDYVKGANIAGFRKVARAMMMQGVG